MDEGEVFIRGESRNSQDSCIEEIEAPKEEDQERTFILAVLRAFRVLLKELGLDRAAGQPSPAQWTQ
jgi:hypothetical protein